MEATVASHQERVEEIYRRYFSRINYDAIPYYVHWLAGRAYADIVKLNLEFNYVTTDAFDPDAIYYLALWLKSNIYNKYISELGVEELAESIARQILDYYHKKTPRAFYITPIQGDKTGSQEEQRIYKEYSERFEIIDRVAQKCGFAVIRIDKTYPISNLAEEIRSEIRDANFLIADLTDERPSCYYEAGYAEALGKPIIYIASKNSVIKPGTETKIHFDIHNNIQYFKNHDELFEKLCATVEKNEEIKKTEL